MYTEYGNKSKLGRLLRICCTKSSVSHKKQFNWWATVHDIDDSMEMNSKKQTNKQNKTKKKKTEHNLLKTWMLLNIWPSRITILSLQKMDNLPIFHKKCSVKFNNKGWGTLKCTNKLQNVSNFNLIYNSICN